MNKKRFKKPTDIDIHNFDIWTTESRKKGHRYAQSDINIFMNEIFTDLGHRMIFDGIIEGLGAIIESAGDSLGDFFDID